MNLGEVTQQLINIDNTEQYKINYNDSAEYKPNVQEAINIAQGWIQEIVSDNLQPPADAVFHAIKGDSHSICDIIYIRYTVDKKELEIAQTFCVISVIIHEKYEEGNKLCRNIMEIGHWLFKESDRMELEIRGRDKTVIWGQHNINNTPPEHGNYIDYLKWWSDGNRIGFVTLKKGKHPSRAIITWTKEFNLNWFNLYED